MSIHLVRILGEIPGQLDFFSRGNSERERVAAPTQRIAASTKRRHKSRHNLTSSIIIDTEAFYRLTIVAVGSTVLTAA